MAQSAPELVGRSKVWLDMLEKVSRAARVSRPILVIGERGTGKELIAERLHYLSPRWDEPFIKVNCAALSEELLDSELFGHEQGSFTGATRRRLGRFEQANGGTLFLDEVATASMRVQEKLLRVIEYGEFHRLGGEDTQTCDVRIVAATNLDLPALAAQGRFRADLLDRLAFDVVTIAPLRARTDDIELLAEHFGRRLARELEQPFPGWSRAALDQMLDHSWPGNARELKNASERATHYALAAIADGAPAEPIALAPELLDPFASPWRPGAKMAPPILPVEAAPPTGHRTTPGTPPPQVEKTPRPETSGPVDFEATVRALELRLLTEALAASNGRQRNAAEALGLTYHQLRGLLRKHGLSGRSEDASPEETHRLDQSSSLAPFAGNADAGMAPTTREGIGLDQGTGSL